MSKEIEETQKRKVSQDVLNGMKKEFVSTICSIANIKSEGMLLAKARVEKIVEHVHPSQYNEFLECMEDIKINNEYLTNTTYIRSAEIELKRRVEKRLYGENEKIAKLFIQNIGVAKNTIDDECRAKSLDTKKFFYNLDFKGFLQKGFDFYAPLFSDFELRIINKLTNERLFYLVYDAPDSSLMKNNVLAAIRELKKEDMDDTPIGNFLFHFKENDSPKSENNNAENSNEIEDSRVKNLIGQINR